MEKIKNKILEIEAMINMLPDTKKMLKSELKDKVIIELYCKHILKSKPISEIKNQIDEIGTIINMLPTEEKLFKVKINNELDNLYTIILKK